MDLSIIIVNYKNQGLTLNCLKSIKAADLANLTYEIIVVDNYPADNLAKILQQQYPAVKVIVNQKNLGMGAANNQGAAVAHGKYLLVANYDTLVFPDTIKKLYAFMESHSDVGLVGPKQFNPDMTLQDTGYRWHSLLTPFYRRTALGKTSAGKKDLARFLMKDFSHDKITAVDWLLGSFFMCRADLIKKIGLFDERFFLYFEDTDLCRRVWQAGYKVIYDPEAQITHNHGRASAGVPLHILIFNSAGRYHIVSWLKYLCKWGIKKPIVKKI